MRGRHRRQNLALHTLLGFVMFFGIVVVPLMVVAWWLWSRSY